MVIDGEDTRINFTADLAVGFVPFFKKCAMIGGSFTVEEAVKIGDEGRAQALERKAYNRLDFHIVVGRKED